MYFHLHFNRAHVQIKCSFTNSHYAMAVIAKYGNLFIAFMHMQSKVERNNRNESPVTSTYM